MDLPLLRASPPSFSENFACIMEIHLICGLKSASKLGFFLKFVSKRSVTLEGRPEEFSTLSTFPRSVVSSFTKTSSFSFREVSCHPRKPFEDKKSLLVPRNAW